MKTHKLTLVIRNSTEIHELVAATRKLLSKEKIIEKRKNFAFILCTAGYTDNVAVIYSYFNFAMMQIKCSAKVSKCQKLRNKNMKYLKRSFLQKELTVLSISSESFVVDVFLGSEYPSDIQPMRTL